MSERQIVLERIGDPTWSLVAAPAGQVPAVPEGEYRWNTDDSALVFVDQEANASSPGRTILEASGFGHDDLPLPLQANLYTGWGHEGAQNVGRIDTLSLADGGVQASGMITVKGEPDDTDDPGRASVLAIALGNVRGVSVDAAMVAYVEEYETDEQDMLVDVVYRVTEWRITGATQTPFPAFAGCRLSVEGVDTEQAFEDPGEAMAAGLVQGVADAAEAIGAEARQVIHAAARNDSVPPCPPDWFVKPDARRDIPMTVEATSRYGTQAYGYMAPFESTHSNTCHVGFPDRCVCAFRSPDGEYPYMMSGGKVICSDGSKVDVATVAYQGGHVDDDGTQPWTTIKANYDDPARAGLQVAMGEDEYGIWFAGRVAPIRSSAEIEVMRACGVSPHWRTRLQGDRTNGPRMIGACVVISEGFPKGVLTASVGDDVLMPATATGPRAVYDGDELVSLVAANGTARLAAAHNPASRGDVDALRADLAEANEHITQLRSRMGMLDKPLREAAVSALG